ncbi:MAG: alcohol dehydrogenase, partial [Verrucomicrobiales bacterium]|nr:alcohol dehydrogenase [Verrucomicrobiales bacterium]
IDLVEKGRAAASAFRAAVIVGIGGGSVIDGAKAIAAMVTNKGPLRNYLEIVGEGQTITQPPLPFVAVPTTSGAGAEATRNAVLTVPSEKVKVSLRSPLMLPRVALIDPELTLQLPAGVTASTGMDALTQCIEPYLSSKSNPMTDPFCRDGITRAARSLRTAVQEGFRIEARIDMSMAALAGGIALANSGLGAVHGLAAPIGGMFSAPHGSICARLLPPTFRKNLEVCEKSGLSTERFDEVARLLTGSRSARASDGVRFLESLSSDFRIPPLSSYGIHSSHLSAICEKASQSSSMKGNPVALSLGELKDILESAS